MAKSDEIHCHSIILNENVKRCLFQVAYYKNERPGDEAMTE